MAKRQRLKSSPTTVRFPKDLLPWVESEGGKLPGGKTELIVTALYELKARREAEVVDAVAE